MSETGKPLDSLLTELKERAKELNCLYTIEDSLNRSGITLETAFHTVINAVPPGWQYPDICKAKLIYQGRTYQTSDFEETEWKLTEPILVQDEKVGEIKVYYLEERPPDAIGPFLKEEKKLLSTISERLGHFILHQKLRKVFEEAATEKKIKSDQNSWQVVLDMIKNTDPGLHIKLLRKMLNLLCWKGIEAAEELLKHYTGLQIKSVDNETDNLEENKPHKIKKIENNEEYVKSILELAEEYLHKDEIFERITTWIQQDKSNELVKILEDNNTSLLELSDAIKKYYHQSSRKYEFSPSALKSLRVSLLRRFFTDQLNYIGIAKKYVDLLDFYHLIDKLIYPPSSFGKLGGKSAGLFLANLILKSDEEHKDVLKDIQTPKTWYITSDGILYFMQYNNLDEILDQKYKEIDEVRLEYPHVIQIFKSSQFPPEVIRGLSIALDDFGDVPLIVRSSSLLEDQLGAAFSGKYKSLFLANQGTKEERLEELMDAISEVYASTFGPDPIEYRAERGLLDFHEEMGVMIQEVVGERTGKYFLPAFAGVAFSNNEFRWSPRIKREDGLIRMVPGLGTRAVDRVSDDYPILASPGQPNLKVNVTLDEMIRYSPQKIDVINLETNQFETVSISRLMAQIGEKYPGLSKVFSTIKNNILTNINTFSFNPNDDKVVVTFNKLFSNTDFLKKAKAILDVLKKNLNTPVDIEFAYNNDTFYLLQCRPQSYSRESSSDSIPKDIPEEQMVFSANKYVSNGKVPEITFAVLVDPKKYSEIEDKQTLLRIGRAVGKINKLLPKRKFILIGPGRWGSRGDIKLGVNVTYSDINNTAMLIEVAIKKGNYLPDLSFGTHFFQDLVEASIRYLPLYPDEKDNFFNWKFFNHSENILTKIAPEFEDLKHVVKVIDIKKSTDNQVLHVLVNAELDEALALIVNPDEKEELGAEKILYRETKSSNHWRWRYKMAEKIASQIEPEKYGVKHIYIFGSVKNAVAGPGSDIDLLVHMAEDDKCNKEVIENWFKGWSLALSEMNYLRTGYKTDGLLDVHFITDKDIENKNSFAIKIGAITDAAVELQMGKN